MTKLCVYYCLLSGVALRSVVMALVEVNGVVGTNVTATCQYLASWTDVKENDKYFCKSPCKKDKHVIVRAAYGRTNYKNRIQLTNYGYNLYVTFINLQKSDTNEYYCGVDRFGLDLFIRVNLKVTDAKRSSPKTTPKTVVVGPALTSAVKSSFTVSSNGWEMTDISTSHVIYSTTSASPGTQANDIELHLMICVGITLTILMVLLQVVRKMVKKQQKVVSSAGVPLEDAQEDVEYHEIRPVAQQTTRAAGASAVVLCASSTDRNGVDHSHRRGIQLAAESVNYYTNYASLNPAPSSDFNHWGARAESRVTEPQGDLVYSVVKFTGQCEHNQSVINESDCIYSLAQLTQTT